MFKKNILLVIALVSMCPLAFATENTEQPKNETPTLPSLSQTTDQECTKAMYLELLRSGKFMDDDFKPEKYNLTLEKMFLLEKELSHTDNALLEASYYPNFKSICLKSARFKNHLCEAFAKRLTESYIKNLAVSKDVSEFYMAIELEGPLLLAALNIANDLCKQNDSQENTKGTQSQQPTPEQKLIDVQQKAEEIKA